MGKFYDAIMGLVVGDALGVPYEFKQRDTFKAEDMTGYGTYNQPPGTWSDDSSLTLATIHSLVERKGINPDDIMCNFANWLMYGRFTPHGHVFDVGRTTQQSIRRYLDEDLEWKQCGGRDKMDNGNGALMRILPLAFVPDAGVKGIEAVAGLTHNHDISQIACFAYVAAAKKLLLTANKGHLNFDGYGPFERLSYIDELSRDEIKSTGYVVHTLEAAMWCVRKTDSYKECVLTAVNLGDDTDTVAAVAGGLAGIIYGIGGEKGIPEEWINQIAKKDWIKGLCERFEKIYGA